MSEEYDEYEYSKKHRKEVLDFINYAQMKADLNYLKRDVSYMLKEYDNDWLNRISYHEAGHKTVENVLWPFIKNHYYYDKKKSTPMTVAKNYDVLHDAYDDDEHELHRTRILDDLAGYAAEALYNKINLNKLGEVLTRLGRMKFYVGSKDEEESDAYHAFRELMESRFDPFCEGEELNIPQLLKEACEILTENEDLFEKNAKSARTYFSKKIKEQEKEAKEAKITAQEN